ncbi:MAG: MBL fold metallo-hydrolase [Prolixibacteraceae bacterium]|jgi:glyoxylase-like metal-dependent hydrolase (beta-lactamase superfamily II)|nr:MBL fold metallo-hydrolase [Prolixibacteraceae bacterium]
MDIYTIDAGTFKCDGGGIFGGIPKVLWSEHEPADEQNRITLAMRCLLVNDGLHKVLIDTGAGEKLCPEFIHQNEINNAGRLIASLKKNGITPEEITDVVHTHLHWDHCGGGTTLNKKGEPVPTFKNATYHCTQTQWYNALNPNEIEESAFFKNDLIPIEKSRQLNLIKEETELFPGFQLRIFNGHTPGMLVPIFGYKHRKVAYINDLFPVIANISLPWIAAYDLYPVTTLEEKRIFLREAYKKQYILMFEHDVNYECATIEWDEKRGAIVDHKGNLFT